MIYSGEISALLTAFLWSLTAIFFEKSSKKVGSEIVNISRLIIALVLLMLTILIAGLKPQLSAGQIKYLALSGVVGLVFGDGFLFKALQKVGARISMVVMSFAPALASILAFFFLGETIRLIALIGIVITLIGIVVVVTDNHSGSVVFLKGNHSGIFFAFLGALGQAVGLIFAKQAFISGEINGFIATTYRILAATIFILPLYFLSQNKPNPLRILKDNTQILKYLIGGSVVGPYLGITFSLIAVANTQVGIASTIMATVPVIMLPISKYYMKETLSKRAIIGAFSAVSGIVLLFLK